LSGRRPLEPLKTLSPLLNDSTTAAVEIATELCGNPNIDNGEAWTRKFVPIT
jgi:hypothetical protein